MKQTPIIHNLGELRARQKILKAEQQLLVKEIINEGKTAVVNLPLAALTKPADPLKVLKVDGKVNPPAKLFSYLLPLIFNRTFFRRSGFVTKTIVALIARKVGKRIGPKISVWLIDILLKYTRNLVPKPRLLK